MAYKMTDAQRKVLREIGQHGLCGVYGYVGNMNTVAALISHGMVIVDRTGRKTITPIGCEHICINYTSMMDEMHEAALADNTIEDTPATFTATCECGQPLTADEGECATCAHFHAQGLQRPETQTVANDYWPCCVECNQRLQTGEVAYCEDCENKLNPANSPEARIARGAMAYALFTPASSFNRVLSHADILGIDREKFEIEYMQHGGIIYFDESTDAAPLIDPRDARIAELEAQVKAFQAQSQRRESLLQKHFDFLHSIKGYSFEDRDDMRAVFGFIDELEAK